MVISNSTIAANGIIQMLEKSFPEYRASFFYPSQALSAAAQQSPLCVVIDVSLNAREYVATVRLLSKTPVLVVVSAERPIEALPLLRVGAMGMIDDRSPEHCFHEAIRHILSGEMHIPDHYVQPLLIASLRREGAVVKGRKMSKTQIRILELVARGMKIPEIAHETQLKEASVYVYMSKIRKELGMSSQKNLEAYLKAHPRTLDLYQS